MNKSWWHTCPGRILTVQRLRIALVCLALQVSGLVFWFFLREMRSPIYAPDFSVLWAAGRAAPKMIYDAQALTEMQARLVPVSGLRPFPYPPTLLPLLEPFGHLAFWPAMAAWSALGAGLFLLAARRMLWSWELVLAAAAPGALFAAFSGQTSLLLGAGVIWAVTTLEARPRLAGAMLGLVAAVKPQLVLLAPLALAARPEALLPFFGAGAAAVAASAAANGPELWFHWLRTLADFDRYVASSPLILDRNLSPAGGMISAGFGPDWLIRMAWGALGVVLVAVTFRRRIDPADRLAALVLGSFLCSPYVMPYDAALLAPAAAAMLRRTYAPAILVFLMLPYVHWVGTVASGLLAICLLGEVLRRRRAPRASAPVVAAEAA